MLRSKTLDSGTKPTAHTQRHPQQYWTHPASNSLHNMPQHTLPQRTSIPNDIPASVPKTNPKDISPRRQTSNEDPKKHRMHHPTQLQRHPQSTSPKTSPTTPSIKDIPFDTPKLVPQSPNAVTPRLPPKIFARVPLQASPKSTAKTPQKTSPDTLLAPTASCLPRNPHVAPKYFACCSLFHLAVCYTWLASPRATPGRPDEWQEKRHQLFGCASCS